MAILSTYLFAASINKFIPVQLDWYEIILFVVSALGLLNKYLCPAIFVPIDDGS